MGIFRSLGGMTEVELSSGDIHRALGRLGDAGIQLYRIETLNELTCRFSIMRRDYRKVKYFADKSGDILTVTKRLGLYWTLTGLRKRPLLVSGFVLLLALTIALPRHIFFVQVQGNTLVPERLIMEKAAECGVRFGTERRQIRSEKVKNALLATIPQLQWAGINSHGCVAVVTVREKTSATEKAVPAVSRIVASRDAVIVTCTAEQGNLICSPGQAVKAGELLISGYTDCGLTIKATRSVGEIYGQTNRNFAAVLPQEYTYRRGITGQTKKYALILGKKRINFYKDSGILGATCGKMSTVNYITLPGGFILPVALVTEVWTSYETRTDLLPADRAKSVINDFAKTCLMEQMLAGQILRSELQCDCENGVYSLQGRYACLEMIGREQSEETLENYGKTD